MMQCSKQRMEAHTLLYRVQYREETERSLYFGKQG